MSGTGRYLTGLADYIMKFAEGLAGGAVGRHTAYLIGKEIALEASEFPFLLGDYRQDLGILYNYMLMDLIARRIDRVDEIPEREKERIKYIVEQEKDCELCRLLANFSKEEEE